MLRISNIPFECYVAFDPLLYDMSFGRSSAVGAGNAAAPPSKNFWSKID